MTSTPRRLDDGSLASSAHYEVREIDPRNPADTSWAAELHRELFAEIGMIAQLGEWVLRRFCYGRLIADGLMGAAIALVDGRPAGLIAFTADSRAVHRATVGSHLFVALRELAIGIILQPRIVLGFPSAARLIWERRNEQREDGMPVAEILAFGVRAEFRHHDFVRSTGIRLSNRLLAYALTRLKASGVQEVRAVLLASNRPAVAFARKASIRVQPYHNAAQPSVEAWTRIDHALEILELPDRVR